MPDLIDLPQRLVRSLDLAAILSLQPHPAWGIGLSVAGLALCLVGYWLYRLMVALAAAVVGGAVAYLLLPAFDVQDTALWSGVIGAMIVLSVVGWFLYVVAVFIVGAFAGMLLGISLWLLTVDRFTSLADLGALSVGSADIPYVAAAAVLPALALGVLALRWERTMVTVVAVILGALAFALGLRYGRLPEAIGAWGAAAAGVAMALGLFLNFRPKRAVPARPVPAPRRRAATE